MLFKDQKEYDEFRAQTLTDLWNFKKLPENVELDHDKCVELFVQELKRDITANRGFGRKAELARCAIDIVEAINPPRFRK